MKEVDWNFFRIYFFLAENERLQGVKKDNNLPNSVKSRGIVMLTRKLLYIGRRKLNLATYLATQRSFSATCLPQMTLRCNSMSTMRGQNSQQHSSQQSRLNSRLQQKIGRSHSTHSHLLDDVGEDLLEDEKEEVTKLTSRFLHTGGMAHQVDHLMFFVILCHL